MNTRHSRKNVISEIIRTQKIRTQDELINALESKGISTTQATLSRDIREIGARKAVGPDGESCYSIPENVANGGGLNVCGIAVSGQICVVHCLPGFAPAVASLLDRAGIGGIMGTVAGDDTVISALSLDTDAEEVKNAVESLFGIINN